MTEKLEFDDKPRHLSRFDLAGAPAPSSAPKPKPKIVEIGSAPSAEKPKPKIVEILDGSSGGAASTTKPKIVEVSDSDDEQPVAAAPVVEASEDGAFDLSSEEPPPLDDVPPLEEPPPSKAMPPPPPQEQDEGPSLMEQMMADANVARDKKLAAKKNEQQRMKKQFGDGLKSNLKKGFLSGGSKKATKKATPKESAPEVIETLRPQRGKAKPGERESALKLEVAEAMASSEHPMVQGLQSGEWITPGLTQKIASNAKLTRAMADPRFDAALKTMAKDPKRAMAMLESEPWLKEAFVELCGQMGGHFTELGKQQQTAANAAPEAVPEAEVGPMARDALRRHQEGDLPAPATADEQKQVDAVLQDEELRGILMDPAMQNLMRQCSDPTALQKAMRDPGVREKFEKLAKAGLIRIER